MQKVRFALNFIEVMTSSGDIRYFGYFASLVCLHPCRHSRIPEGLVRFRLPLPKEFLLGELDREPFPLPLVARLFLGSCFIPHPRREMFFASFLFEVLDHHLFQSDFVPRFTRLNSILNVKRQQWLWLF